MNTIHATRIGRELHPVFSRTRDTHDTMKKRLQKTLELTCVAAIFAACIITNEAGDPCLWNYALLALAGLTGWAAKRMGRAAR